MNNALSIFSSNANGLQNAHYSENANAIIANGYTSGAGNSYFNAVRFADGIVVKEDVGIGYKYSFLNALRIYSLEDQTLLAERGFHCHIYSKENVKDLARNMLMQLIKEAAESKNLQLNEKDAKAKIEEVVNNVFNNNQLSAFNKLNNKRLNS